MTLSQKHYYHFIFIYWLFKKLEQNTLVEYQGNAYSLQKIENI